MANKTRITLNITEDLLRRLKRLAEIDERSISNFVCRILKRYIEGEEVGK